MPEPVRLRTAIASYPHTAALIRGEVASPAVALDFADVKPVYKAFKPMVREQAFDVSEMAIVTYLQARAYGKPLVLVPAVMMGRFQQNCLLYNSERGALTLRDLPGRRVGVRAYTQTTGAWLRGILQNDYGVDTGHVRWVTFEDAHVAEYRDPPGVERAAAGKDMTAMLLAGELDAAIYGTELPSDPRLRSVIADPEQASRAWYEKHRLTPVNHLVVVTEAVARSPEVVKEVYHLFRRGKQAAPSVAGIDLAPFGVEQNRAALQRIIDYAVQQQLIPRRLTVDELFDDTTRALN